MAKEGFSLTSQKKEFSNSIWKPSILSEDSVGTPENSQWPVGRRYAGFNFGGSASVGYMWYDKRLESFTHWPKHHPMKPESLAGAGFYYTGFSDKLRCFAATSPYTSGKYSTAH